MQTTDVRGARGLVRRPNHRWVAGVAGGFADATGISSVWWRIGFLLLALVGGLGVAIYLVLWVILPRADLPRSAGERVLDRIPGIPGWIGTGLLVFGSLLLITRIWPAGFTAGIRPPFAHQIRDASPGFALAVFLIGLGLILFRGQADPSGETAPPRARLPEFPGVDDVDAPEDLEAPALLGGRPRPPRPPRERSWLGWLAMGLALGVGGVLWMLQESGSITLTLGQLLAVPLAVLGLGLLVGAFAGRARWTLLIGLPLVPLAVFGSLLPLPFAWHWSNRSVTPRTASELAPSYELSGASLRFDLTGLGPNQHPVVPTTVTVGVGEIEVLVPKGAPVDIRAEVGLGSIQLRNRTIGGLHVEDALIASGPDPIRLHLVVGIGDVQVYWVAAPQPRSEGKNHGSGGRPTPTGSEGGASR
jgi:phage shock protein PspC (stress-responsive transcriptional regulator)